MSRLGRLSTKAILSHLRPTYPSRLRVVGKQNTFAAVGCNPSATKVMHRSLFSPISLFIALLGWLLLVGSKPARAQSEPIPHQEIDPSGKAGFSLFDNEFYKNQLFLLGETHGFKNTQAVDLALLKHLNQRIGVRYYIAEVDPTKAYYINQYLQTGQDSTLRLVFVSWIAETMQWANRDFFRKIQAIRAYNQTIPAKKRIRFVGIDEVQDRQLIARQLTELLENQSIKTDSPRLDSLVTLLRTTPQKSDTLAAQVALNWLAQIKNHPVDYRKWPAETLTELCATLQTLAYRKTIRSREKTIFTTFRDALVRYNLTNEKLYGFWGVAHVWQAPLADGRLKFAGMIQASDLPMKGKTVSITCSYVDSFMMVPSQYLPPFWQEKGKVYSRVDKFNSNGPMMTVSGTDELIKQSRPNTLTLFKLPGTAAGKAPITATYSPFMPADQRYNFDPARPTTDYFQYIVLIRNSEMTEPMEIKN